MDGLSVMEMIYTIEIKEKTKKYLNHYLLGVFYKMFNFIKYYLCCFRSFWKNINLLWKKIINANSKYMQKNAQKREKIKIKIKIKHEKIIWHVRQTFERILW